MFELADNDLLKTQSYVGGQWIDSDDKGVFEVENPATGVMIARGARCGAAETGRAIEAAKAALGSWQRLTALKNPTTHGLVPSGHGSCGRPGTVADGGTG